MMKGIKKKIQGVGKGKRGKRGKRGKGKRGKKERKKRRGDINDPLQLADGTCWTHLGHPCQSTYPAS